MVRWESLNRAVVIKKHTSAWVMELCNLVNGNIYLLNKTTAYLDIAPWRLFNLSCYLGSLTQSLTHDILPHS